MDGDDTRVIQRRRRPRFLNKPAAAIGVVDLVRWEDLDRDHPVEVRVARFVDDAHAAFADALEDLVVRELASDHGWCSVIHGNLGMRLRLRLDSTAPGRLRRRDRRMICRIRRTPDRARRAGRSWYAAARATSAPTAARRQGVPKVAVRSSRFADSPALSERTVQASRRGGGVLNPALFSRQHSAHASEAGLPHAAPVGRHAEIAAVARHVEIADDDHWQARPVKIPRDPAVGRLVTPSPVTA